MIDLTAQVTQSQFGALVGISQPAVSSLVSRGVLIEGACAGDWLHAYCEHLREIAAGRGGDGVIELATERALLAREQRKRVAMQNAVTEGELAPRVLLVEALARTAPRICGLLESIVPALRRRSGYSADDLAFVAQTIADARNAVASMTLDDVLDDMPGVDEPTLEDAA